MSVFQPSKVRPHTGRDSCAWAFKRMVKPCCRGCAPILKGLKTSGRSFTTISFFLPEILRMLLSFLLRQSGCPSWICAHHLAAPPQLLALRWFREPPKWHVLVLSSLLWTLRGYVFSRVKTSSNIECRSAASGMEFCPCA